MSVIHKAVYKRLVKCLKCGPLLYLVALISMEFSYVRIIPNLTALFFVSTFLCLYREAESQSQPVPAYNCHTWFSSPRAECIWVRGKAQSWTRASYTAWPQSEFSLCDQAYSQLPCNASWQGRRGVKKKKKIKTWAPRQVFRVKYWSPWEKQMFGTANPSALSHSNSVRWSHPSLPEYAVLLSMETGF